MKNNLTICFRPLIIRVCVQPKQLNTVAVTYTKSSVNIKEPAVHISTVAEHHTVHSGTPSVQSNAAGEHLILHFKTQTVHRGTSAVHEVVHPENNLEIALRKMYNGLYIQLDTMSIYKYSCFTFQCKLLNIYSIYLYCGRTLYNSSRDMRCTLP